VRFDHARRNLAPLKVPHIGWNQLWLKQADHPLLTGLRDGDYAYFVHSYHAQPVDQSCVLATTDYGYEFPSIVAQGNVWGLQFHPEKSQDVGLRLLRNFVAWSALAGQEDSHVYGLSSH